jgi:Tfp pilus assembly protein PilO
VRCERQQLGIFIFFGVMIAVFAVLQYKPLRSRAQAMEQLKSTQLSVDAKVGIQISKLPSLRAQLEQTQAKVGNYKAMIPDERNLGTFLQEIADVMTVNNLTEQMVQPDSETKIDGLMCIPVRIQCKGSSQQIFGFFKSLATLERLVRIEQVQLKNDNDLSGMVTMTMRGNIYYKL